MTFRLHTYSWTTGQYTATQSHQQRCVTLRDQMTMMTACHADQRLDDNEDDMCPSAYVHAFVVWHPVGTGLN